MFSSCYRINQFILIRGFTLLETLIVLGIILILSHVASASYQHYLMKSARINAKVMILNTAAALERYYNEYHTYANVTVNGLGISSMTDDGRYQIALAQASRTHYVIAAIPVDAQVMDKKCGTLMLNEKNEPSITGTASIHRCWLN